MDKYTIIDGQGETAGAQFQHEIVQMIQACPCGQYQITSPDWIGYLVVDVDRKEVWPPKYFPGYGNGGWDGDAPEDCKDMIIALEIMFDLQQEINPLLMGIIKG